MNGKICDTGNDFRKRERERLIKKKRLYFLTIPITKKDNALAVKSVVVGPCCHDVDKALLVDAASDNTVHVTPFAIFREFWCSSHGT
jgi:hypothetical protein